MRNLLFSLSFLCFLTSSAQEVVMRDVFCQMPDSIVPYLAKNNRLDFVDFIDSNMDAVVTNSLGGKSKMKKLTANYASLQLNDAASLEMRLLPVTAPVDSAQQIICLVRTYGKDFRESTVTFYSLKWRQLPVADYLVSDARAFVAKLAEDVSILTLTAIDYLDSPANEEQKTHPQPLTTLKWEGRFVKKD